MIAAACGGGSTGQVDPGSASASESEGGDSSSAIAGTARDARTNAALGGVRVSGLGLSSATTASDGTYRLNASAGTYTLQASRDGYASASQQVTVPRYGTLTVNWALIAATVAPAPCTYTYGPWGACQSDGTQTRPVASSTPIGCVGTPATTQSCTPAPATPPTGASFKVFANNDLGMHCVDKSFSVFSILPPYNVVDAQVVALQSSGKPVLLDASQARISYSAIADASGSINSTSAGKTDFWDFAAQLYGAQLDVGQGLAGMWMPKDAPSAAGTTLAWDQAMGLFKAPGIPIFPTDDAGKVNRYPLMRFSAFDPAGKLLGATDTVLPVSDETSCQNCHATGKVAASGTGTPWSNDPDLESQARRNVLLLHNARTGTSLSAPVLCASCHYSPALDLSGAGPSAQQSSHKTMSSVMHAFHADKMAGLSDAPVAPGGAPADPAKQACYQCHPGASTQCLRGAMTTNVGCQNCHGNMAAVGGHFPLLAGGSTDGANDGKPRRPWLDLPRCQSCHANDAMSRTTLAAAPPLAADGLRFVNAFLTGDASASPILASNTRFAQETGKLFRKSKGHGGLACEACHGSTHAIWSGNANDNVAATALQGHSGTVGECSACHLSPPANGLGGPHGMHPVGSAWVSAHQSRAGSNLPACRACHGANDRGTILSRMFSTRTLAGHTLAAGTVIGCYTCHNGPNPD